jgi:2-polyprenyl-3-methyl-5-hydroxy-6-metoxy-1,4-benzoquinol methylase
MHSPYTSAYYQALRDGARRSAQATVPPVMPLLAPRSVIDMGCGEGMWLSVFREHGVADLCGVDGDYVDHNRLEIPADCFRVRDLALPLRLERRFDLATSLEVAEHLPPECSEMFVESLVCLAETSQKSAACHASGGAA